jgi:hypothetical protein
VRGPERRQRDHHFCGLRCEPCESLRGVCS